MTKRPTAREMETEAASARARGRGRPGPQGEALAMLARRNLKPVTTRPDLPFPSDLSGEIAERLSARLGHYAFRLFLRGAIQRPEGFSPEEATGYVRPAKCRELADALVDLGLAVQGPRGRYHLLRSATSFGGTLEWYVGRELSRRFGFDTAAGVKFHARGVGGDLDVVAAAEGKLVYLELKSSPPKHLSQSEVAAFFDRVQLLRPDVTLFVVDTALRLADKVVPMLMDELMRRRGGPVAPVRVERELWALTPHLYAVNSKPDLMANVGRAIAEGLLALGPGLP
jgi:hypothetical protein